MRYYKIVSQTDTEIAKASDYSINSTTSLRGMNIVSISKISITNASDNVAYVKLFQDVLTGSDADKHFHLLGGTQTNAKVEIPVGVTLVLDDPFSLNVNTHKLVLANTGTNPLLTVRIN